MKRMLHLVTVALTGMFLAAVLGACGNDPAPSGQSKEGFYEDGFDTGDSYPYTKAAN